ncbi:MAG TPA: CpaF family protein [Alphaproteobacteria bacterium]|nr:CpaF family protein [Alphaproteobacteria bacterium]
MPDRKAQLEDARRILSAAIGQRLDPAACRAMSRGELARLIGEAVATYLSERSVKATLLEQRDLVTVLLNELLNRSVEPAPAAAPTSAPTDFLASNQPAAKPAPAPQAAAGQSLEAARRRLQSLLLERMDVAAAAQLPRPELERQVAELIGELLAETKLHLNMSEQRDLVAALLDEMLGLGPLEPLLKDESITDIMVNGAKQVYVERRGKLELSGVTFRDDAHVMNIATRIVTRIGRRIDESSPLCDARLQDGSRVNIIIPPLAIDGPSISIRKFGKKNITLDTMVETKNISPAMCTVLKIASRCRLNILISGGTGSGKTTLLNALSRQIDHGERVVTIEDAAELRLQQPHVVRLETRPANLEGDGEITMRDLVKNALRMRPDRIILGEIRGSEAIDMLQAMNTGHDGSMCTIHANRPREALTRLENMVGMAGINLPSKAVRTQIAAAVNMIVQVSRMRDGIRRITHVMEIVGMEGDVITTQDLFLYQYEGEDKDGILQGSFQSTGIRPAFLPKAEYYGLDRALLEAL